MLERIAREPLDSPLAIEEYRLREVLTARASFWEYRVAMNPRFMLRGKWFPRSLAGRLRRFWDDFRAGKRPILLLCCPPQFGKSLSILDFVAWAAGQDRDLRVIYASFSDRLSTRANLRTQRALDSALYRRIFPRTRIAAKGAGGALRNFDILEFLGGDGYFRNSTVLGSITGEALDLGVIDDPIKGRLEANSLIVRDKVWNWLVDDVFSRFSDRAGLLLTMTRWHLDDPAGRLLDHFGDRVMLVRYPALAEQDEQYRKIGEPLFPELKSMEFLEQRRSTMTRSSWEALYQQSPIVAGGGMFPLDKIDIVPERPVRDVVAAARYWDCAGTASGGAYTAGVLMLRMRDGTFVIADVRRGQWSALDRQRIIKQTAVTDHGLYPTTRIYLEQEPGSGGKEAAEAAVRMLAGYTAEADRVTGSKELRAEPFAAQWQSGNVRLVAGEYVREYLNEAEFFPNSKFKDQIDASTGAFNKIASKYRYPSDLSWVS